MPRATRSRDEQCVCLCWGGVEQATPQSAPVVRCCIWRNLLPDQLLSVEPTASLRVCVRMSRSDILPISLVHTVDCVYGCALQDGVLSTGAKQNRVGSSREVPGPEADWNRSIWHRVVSQGGKNNQYYYLCMTHLHSPLNLKLDLKKKNQGK